MDCDRRRSGHSRVCRKAHARLGPTGGRPSAGGFPAQLARNGLMAARYTVEQLRARGGQELGVSECLQGEQQIGRASCREKVVEYVWIPGVAVALKQNKNRISDERA